MSTDCTNELLAALVSATPDAKAAALRMFRGDGSGGEKSKRVALEPFVGLQDVADFLRVSRRSVWRWQVPCHRFGTRTRYRLSEVVAYLDGDLFKRRMAELKEERRDSA